MMKGKIIEKNDGGYTLRLAKGDRIVMGFVGVFFGIIALFFLMISLVAFSDGSLWKGLLSLIPVLVFLSLVWLAMHTTWGVTLRVDRAGVHFCRKLGKERHIPWEDVQDWGVAYQDVKGGRTYYLYFATEVLELAHWGRDKKLPMGTRKAVNINVHPKHLSSLKTSGMIHYCRECLGYRVPMFGGREERDDLGA